MSVNIPEDALIKLKRTLSSCMRSDDESLFQASFDGLKVERKPSLVIKPD